VRQQNKKKCEETMSDSNTTSKPSGVEMNQSPETALATKKQLAARYRVCVRTIDSWTAKKILPHLKFSSRLIRYPVAECDRALAERFKINAH
jgi:hypothetical protein